MSTNPLHRASVPNFRAADGEFLRNLSNSRSFSQNPRWKRHASLDAGIGGFRSRMNSMYDGEDSPTGPYDSMEEHKRLLHDFGSPLSPFGPAPSRFPSRRNVVRLILVTMVVFLLGLIGGAQLLSWAGDSDWWGLRPTLVSYGVPFVSKGTHCKNPYSEYGRMMVDQTVPENNRWLPYDRTCSPPTLMASLRETIVPTMSDLPLQLPLPTTRPIANDSLPLPWLHGKTVVLFGDHVERLHNKDFCRFAGGRFVTIGADHPLSPPRFQNGIDEKLPGANQTSFDGSRPAVCYVEQYDFMVISVFHFGLANRVEFEHESLLWDQHFYPPVAVQDRLSHILLPLLLSLDRRPDLLEFSSGFWDLRHFTALDELAHLDPFAGLSHERLQWYSDRLRFALADLSSVFPGTPILWRALHHTPKFTNTPFARVAALDQLSRKVVKELNKSRKHSEAEFTIEDAVGEEGGKKKKLAGFKQRLSSHASFLNLVKERIGKAHQKVENVNLANEDTTLQGLVRVDEWGSLMLGQQHLMNNVHTPPLPGGYVWGDVMLYELRRAVHADPAITD